MANYLLIAATSDIGREVATQLSQQGHDLFLTGRNESRLQEIASETGAKGHAIVAADDFDEVDAVVQQALSELGSLEGVACMAGSVILKGAHLTSRAEYEATMKANIEPAFAVTRAVAKHVKQSSSIVLMGTAAAMQGIANHEAIAAAKGAVIALAQSAAATYATQGLRFNTVCPGLTQTRLTEKLTANEMSRKFSTAMHAVGELGEASDVAAMVSFLLAPENRWITGQTIGVDGGLSRVMPKVKA